MTLTYQAVADISDAGLQHKNISDALRDWSNLINVLRSAGHPFDMAKMGNIGVVIIDDDGTSSVAKVVMAPMILCWLTHLGIELKDLASDIDVSAEDVHALAAIGFCMD